MHLTRQLALRAKACLLAVVGLHAADTLPPPPRANATNRFTITGMHCNGCAQGLASELKRARGITSASVSFTNRLAVVTFDTNQTATAALVKVIEEAGFKARQLKR